MKKKIISFLLLVLCLFMVVGCSNTEEAPVDPTPPGPVDPNPPGPVDPNPPGPVEPTDKLDPYDELVKVSGLEIKSNGHNVVYMDEGKFTAEGYDVELILTKANPYDSDNPYYDSISITNFSINDGKVDYLKEGTYTVTITARYLHFVAEGDTKITIKADRYEYLGVKHLFSIKCDEQIKASTADDIKPSGVYAIYTENKYENGELVLTEERIRSGYELEGVEDVDLTKAGKYVVYVKYSQKYGDVTITVKTFFIVVVE